MRYRILLLLAVCLALPAFAQQLVTANLTAAASACQLGTTPAACLFLQIGPTIQSVDITVAGTYSGTIQFEFSGDAGATWKALLATPSAGGSQVSSTTGTDTWTASAGAHSFIRIRCSAYTSGSATATLNPSQAVTASAGGGAAAWAGLTGDLTETQQIAFDGPTPGKPDTCITRGGAASVFIGNCTTNPVGGGAVGNGFLAQGEVSGSVGSVGIFNGGGTTGYVAWFNSSGSRTAYMGADSGGDVSLNIASGAFNVVGTAAKAPQFTVLTKCAANSSSGTVACGAYSAGSFSCDTSTSAGTCTIDTSAVAANSAIWVEPDASLSTLLGVTCNTTADTGLTAPRIASRTAATSFVINMGTFTTQRMCFSYAMN